MEQVGRSAWIVIAKNRRWGNLEDRVGRWLQRKKATTFGPPLSRPKVFSHDYMGKEINDADYEGARADRFGRHY
jgi:hypothetical protein